MSNPQSQPRQKPSASSSSSSSSSTANKPTTYTLKTHLTPLLLTTIFLLLIETASLHPYLPHAGKAWVLLMSMYTFRRPGTLTTVLEFIAAGVLLRVLVSLALCRLDLYDLQLRDGAAAAGTRAARMGYVTSGAGGDVRNGTSVSVSAMG